MAVQDVRVEVADGVGWVRLDSPARRNALSRAMAESMRGALAALAVDSRVRALVVTGDERAFCAGVDLTDDTEVEPPLSQVLEQLVEDVWNFPAPTVAVVHGPCLGVGCALAAACDVRVAHPEATFAVPGARLGIPYPQASVRRLVDLVGPGRSNLVLLTGRRTGAREAALWGLVDVCADDVDHEVQTTLRAMVEIDAELSRGTREAIRG